jgi:hypothetical protein
LDIFIILAALSLEGRLYFWKRPEVIRMQIRGNRVGVPFQKFILGQKLLDREHLVSWSTVTVENPIVGPKFRPLSMHSFI